MPEIDFSQMTDKELQDKLEEIRRARTVRNTEVKERKVRTASSKPHTPKVEVDLTNVPEL